MFNLNIIMSNIKLLKFNKPFIHQEEGLFGLEEVYDDPELEAVRQIIQHQCFNFADMEKYVLALKAKAKNKEQYLKFFKAFMSEQKSPLSIIFDNWKTQIRIKGKKIGPISYNCDNDDCGSYQDRWA